MARYRTMRQEAYVEGFRDAIGYALDALLEGRIEAYLDRWSEQIEPEARAQWENRKRRYQRLPSVLGCVESARITQPRPVHAKVGSKRRVRDRKQGNVGKDGDS